MNNNYNKYFTETDNGLNIEANNIDANCITSRNNTFSLDSEGNLSVNSISFNTSENNLLSFEAIFNKVYPVGAIYISVNNINPGTLFTGVWQRIENVFLLGAGSNYNIGSTGGEKEHYLTVGEMPSHTHTYLRNKILNSEPTSEGGTSIGATNVVNNQKTYASTLATGGNAPHNNMPPYLAVNIWKRIS